jgi:nucleotide-binding universal stress UspA family protein
MTSVLAVLDATDSANQVLTASACVAARLAQCAINVLHVRPSVDPLFLPTEEIMTPARKASFDAAVTALSEALRKRFEHWHASIPAAIWQAENGVEAEVVSRHAASADFVVISQMIHARAGGGRSAVTAALFEAHAPVIIVPPSMPDHLGTHVAVAWKASDQAARAIQSACALLHAAEQVTFLVGAEHGDEKPPPDDALQAAASDKNQPAIRRFELQGQSVGDALLREAKQIGADLLVMGAYSHPRVVEFILGGATRDVLRNLSLPVLMHH